MSASNIEYLIHLHLNGLISTADLWKELRALNALEDLPGSQKLEELEERIYTQAASPEPTQSKALEKSHRKRRKKKKTKQNEDLVIKPLCGYGIEYEIDTAPYKDLSMFKDKRSKSKTS